jgi:hypothetical protein
VDGPPVEVQETPRLKPGALTASKGWSEWRRVVEVAAPFGLPLAALSSFAAAALAGALDLGRGPLEAGPDLIGLQRALLLVEHSNQFAAGGDIDATLMDAVAAQQPHRPSSHI